MQVVLFEPEIPQNTGNIIRLCANTGSSLHLIEPMGFSLEDKWLRRAGLDYRDKAVICIHKSWHNFKRDCSPKKMYALSTKASKVYTSIEYEEGVYMVFGPETRGLTKEVMSDQEMTGCLRLPMAKDSRSLNLSNAVAIVVYEGLRQQGFAGLV